MHNLGCLLYVLDSCPGLPVERERVLQTAKPKQAEGQSSQSVCKWSFISRPGQGFFQDEVKFTNQWPVQQVEWQSMFTIPE